MKFFCLSIILLSFSICQCQTDTCPIISDSFRLIRINIHQKDMYPIIMLGILIESKEIQLDRSNVNFFLNSFYEKAYYVPSIPDGIYSVAPSCLGDSIGYDYVKKNKYHFTRLAGSFTNFGLKKNIILSSGENVSITEVLLKGSLWILDKQKAKISQSSNEINISEISKIKTFYVPMWIEVFEKPKCTLLK